ncbi:MAG TPA: thioredoxin-like domain-containing protein [Vicinamibacterales bacterium]|nr:thioredoxin-like domain-containing protein [Vicinamibacterales bacterium]
MFVGLIFSLLFAQADRLTVLVFTTTDCPISNRYAPEIQRLAAKFGEQAKFILVYPVPSDSPQAIAAHHKKFGYSLSYERDADQALVKKTGVTVTPEVAVMRGSTLVYHGRIDDRYVAFGVERPRATTHDLEDALNAAIAGKTIAIKETRAVGCILADLVK